MAIYHLSVKAISRSAGRSATAAAAYRSGARIEDRGSGLIHDYRRRSGVAGSFVVAPATAEWAADRAELWNAAELAEKRCNSTVAREYELALPAELDAVGRSMLAKRFARHLVETYGVAADVAIHVPNLEGDQRNHHAHILTTTRVVEADGSLGAKTRILDAAQTGSAEIEKLRSVWAEMANQALLEAGRSERIDHRSRAAAGLVGPGTKHLGPDLTAVERRRRREARQAGAAYVPGSRRARLNNEIREARQDYSRAARELREIQADQEAQEQQRRAGETAVAQRAGLGTQAAQEAQERAVRQLLKSSPPRASDPLAAAAKVAVQATAPEPLAKPAPAPWRLEHATDREKPLVALLLLFIEKRQRREPIAARQEALLGAVVRALGEIIVRAVSNLAQRLEALRYDPIEGIWVAKTRETIRSWEIPGPEMYKRLRQEGHLGGPETPDQQPKLSSPQLGRDGFER